MIPVNSVIVPPISTWRFFAELHNSQILGPTRAQIQVDRSLSGVMFKTTAVMLALQPAIIT